MLLEISIPFLAPAALARPRHGQQEHIETSQSQNQAHSS
jgi:hypothetical protein